MNVGVLSKRVAIQRSYIWTRVSKFLWPFIIIIAAVRAALMIVELQRGYVALFICFAQRTLYYNLFTFSHLMLFHPSIALRTSPVE